MLVRSRSSANKFESHLAAAVDLTVSDSNLKLYFQSTVTNSFNSFINYHSFHLIVEKKINYRSENQGLYTIEWVRAWIVECSA